MSKSGTKVIKLEAAEKANGDIDAKIQDYTDQIVDKMRPVVETTYVSTERGRAQW